MQATARELGDLPRAEVAKMIGAKTRQAVTMRIRRALKREGRPPTPMLRPPQFGRMIVCPPETIDLLALSA